jgi:hypothetical protein
VLCAVRQEDDGEAARHQRRLFKSGFSPFRFTVGWRIGEKMAQRQFPPRFVIRYEDAALSTPTMPRGRDKSDERRAHNAVHERGATTLAGAKSIQRALRRRGLRILGVYERINLHFRPALDEQTEEYGLLVCGRLAWEWESERRADD